MNYLFLSSFSKVLSDIGYILLAVLVLLIMITVHELGHFISGKIFHFKIKEFSIGFGPKLFYKQKKDGEKFTLRLLPFGGFCSFSGEDGDTLEEGDFYTKKPWQRIIVLISGAFMNFILALLIIVLMFGIYGAPTLKAGAVNIDGNYEITESLNEGDVILSINDKNIYLFTDIMDALDGKKQGDYVNFKLDRKGEIINKQIKLRKDGDFSNVEDLKNVCLILGTYSLNEEKTILYSGLSTNYYKFNFFSTIGRSFEYSIKLSGTIFTVLGQLLTGKLGLSAVGGTVTTITTTADAIKLGGISYLLYIASFIGVNLAVFNLLPIPALDGSHVVFTIIEWIRKKPVNKKIENVIHTIGFIAILIFAVLIDLQHCF